MNILTMDNIKKTFNNNDVLRDISLKIDEGEVVSIIGPSGSGKSTLLRIATLLEKMDDGQMSYLGKDIVESKNNKAEYASKNIIKKAQNCFGLVFQNYNLFPHYTVLKNLMDAPIHVQKRDKKEVEKEALELLEKMNLSDKANAYPSELSGGQKQRVAIARALAMKPKMLFFDEPTSALDPELTRDILTIIKGLASINMTMLIVTHEINFARDVSDRIIFIDGGYIVEQGDAKELINHPKEERTKQFLSNYY